MIRGWDLKPFSPAAAQRGAGSPYNPSGSLSDHPKKVSLVLLGGGANPCASKACSSSKYRQRAFHCDAENSMVRHFVETFLDRWKSHGSGDLSYGLLVRGSGWWVSH